MTEKKEYHLQMEAIAEHDGNWYASVMDRNALYRHNERTNRTIKIGMFKGYDPQEWRLHCAARFYEGCIYFFPDRAKCIHKLDLATDELSSIDIGIRKESRFINALIMSDKAYCIQSSPRKALRIVSLSDYDVKEVSLPFEESEGSLQRDIEIDGDRFYIIDSGIKRIVGVNSRTDELTILDVNSSSGEKGGFGTIQKVNSLFYLTTQTGILKWNREKNRVEQFSDYPKGYGMTFRNQGGEVERHPGFAEHGRKFEQPFSTSLRIKDDFVLFPCRTNMCIRFNTLTEMMEEMIFPGEDENEDTLCDFSRTTYCHYILLSEKKDSLIFSTCTRKMYHMEENGQFKSAFLCDNIFERMWEYGFRIFAEDQEYKLGEDFIEFICGL